MFCSFNIGAFNAMSCHKTNFVVTLLESQIYFKQGLQSPWEKTYTVLYSNQLSVYTDEKKTIELFTFYPETSQLTFRANSEKGVFILNNDKSTKFFLFETGSELMLGTWLSTFKVVGWSSTPVQYDFRVKPRDEPSNWTYSSISLSNSLSINRSSDMLLPKLQMTSSMERSFSLPSLLPIEKSLQVHSPQNDLKKHRTDNKRTNEKQYSAKLHTENMTSPFRAGISESGYCSKESLLLADSERHGPLGKQGLVNSQLHHDDLVSCFSLTPYTSVTSFIPVFLLIFQASTVYSFSWWIIKKVLHKDGRFCSFTKTQKHYNTQSRWLWFSLICRHE